MTRKPMEFGKTVADVQDELLRDESTIANVEAALFAEPYSRHRTRTRTAKRVLPLAAAFAVGCVVMAFGSSLLPSKPLSIRVNGTAVERTVGAWIEARNDQRVPIVFSDGSSVMLSPDTGARVISTSPRGASVLLERGKIHVNVVHSDNGEWFFDTGPFSIRVTGTSFDVAWEPDTGLFSLSLIEGSVEVTGPSIVENRRVAKGETFRAWVDKSKVAKESQADVEETLVSDRHPTTDPMPEPDEVPPQPRDIDSLETGEPEEEIEVSLISSLDEPSVTLAANATQENTRKELPRPRFPGIGLAFQKRDAEQRRASVLSEEGASSDHSTVTESAPKNESSQEESASPNEKEEIASPFQEMPKLLADPEKRAEDEKSANQLLGDGDRARLSKRFDEARRIYKDIRGKFGGTRASALAAFALGRIAFDREKDYPSAARWFDAYLKEHRGNELKREALGRLLESYYKSKEEGRALDAAKRYIRRYPDGPHAALARSIVEE